MDLTQLTAFVTVAEELHFGRAAARCHLSQSAVSKQIAQLEAELELTLFARDRRSVRLTSVGRQLLPAAVGVLDTAAALRGTARRIRQGDIGQLRVGFTPTAPHGILPALMRAFRQCCPGVVAELHEQSSEEQLRSLRRNDLDVGILRAGTGAGPGLKAVRTFEERFSVVVGKEHPLARRKRLALADLAKEPWVLVHRDASPSVHAMLLDACRGAGFSPRIAQTVSQVHAAVAVVASGIGVSVVPESAKHTRTPGSVFVPLEERLTTALSIVCSDSESSPALERFVEVAARFSPALPR